LLGGVVYRYAIDSRCAVMSAYAPGVTAMHPIKPVQITKVRSGEKPGLQLAPLSRQSLHGHCSYVPNFFAKWIQKMLKNSCLSYLATSLFGLTLVANVARADLILNFGVYTSDKPSSMVKQFRPVLNVLEADLTGELGEKVKIRIQVAKTYRRGIEDLVTGQVDFSRVGPASYIEAIRQEPNISILAIESNNGKKIFYGIICVRRDSSIMRVEDLRGTRFAFGSKRSTIGRYLSQNHLLGQGIRASDLAHFEYLGRHDKVGTAVAMDTFDAGALKESTFKMLLEKGEPLREIARFPNVTKPWVAGKGLTPAIRDALGRALLKLDDPVALKALNKSGFLPGREEDYSVIRAAMDSNSKFFE
jgi:phosphonate transport system substrate-binding protein